MSSFDFLWQMLDKHGVIERYKADCSRLWDRYNLAQQRAIYRSRKQPDGTYKVYVHEAPKTKRSIGLVSEQHRTNIGPTSRDKRNLKNQSNEKRKQSPS